MSRSRHNKSRSHNLHDCEYTGRYGGAKKLFMPGTYGGKKEKQIMHRLERRKAERQLRKEQP